MGRIHELARNSPDSAAVRAEVDRGTPVDDRDAMGKTALHYAARNGNYVVVETLIELGCALDLENNRGQTALYHAVVGQHSDIVSLLLQTGANASAVTEAGYTPLHYAARNGLTGILKLLLTAGASLDAVTEEGHTAEALATEASEETAVKIIKHFQLTGLVDDNADAVEDPDEAELLAELDALEVKPKPISAGPVYKPGRTPVDKESDNAPDGYGKVYVGKAPPPHMMNHVTNGAGAGTGAGAGARKMVFDPDAAPAAPAVAAVSTPSGALTGKESDGVGKVYVGKTLQPHTMNHTTNETEAGAELPASATSTILADPTRECTEQVVYASAPETMEPSHGADGSNKSAVYASVDRTQKKVSKDMGAPAYATVDLSKKKKNSTSGPVLDQPPVPTAEDDLYATVDDVVAQTKVHIPRPGTQSLALGTKDSSETAGIGGGLWLDNMAGAVGRVSGDNSALGTVTEDTYDNAEAGAVPTAQTASPAAVPISENVYAEVDELYQPGTGASQRLAASVGSSLLATPGTEEYAAVDDLPAKDESLGAFFQRIGLPEKCLASCENAGIDVPQDIMLFTEKELVDDYGFKAGHVRKALKALGK